MQTPLSPPSQPSVMHFAAHWARRVAPSLLAVLVCALLLAGLQRLTLSLDYHAVVRHLFGLPATAVAEALAATVLSYLVL